MKTIKIATYNVNGINRRWSPLQEWLERDAPDIVCLQELKCTDRDFPGARLRAAGYGAVWKGQPLWNGVAILARGAVPIPTRRELPGDPKDEQSRYLEAACQGIVVGCLYLPNGNPQPGPKFQYKLSWFERLLVHAQSLHDSGHPVVLIGDYNVVPTDFDIYNPRSYLKNALLQPAPREQYQRLLGQGWVDALRAKHPEQPMFTFWDYLRQRWERDAGLRLDHLLLNPQTAPRLVDAGVDRWVRSLPDSSDHAPAWITLAPEGKRPAARLASRRSLPATSGSSAGKAKKGTHR